ncbi:MAG: FIST C-terminal domain-containing protein, partial [Undibacterium curvum]|uniref:FIST C-terminal domain-containing protein n=1 Tax=Undibacterium curvum TaxID=2762294 RepID=UPI003BCD219C
GQIRTILGINEQDGSLILAGSINPDGYLRLMHAQTNELVDGAETAASAALPKDAPHSGQALAMLVSCVGRKLVMGGRVDEEVEVVQDLMGSQTVICGFYSNGEICPGYQLQVCSLHNQTMTISYMAERM